MAELDVERLQSELQSLTREQRELSQRLRVQSGPGGRGGRGFGGPPGSYRDEGPRRRPVPDGPPPPMPRGPPRVPPGEHDYRGEHDWRAGGEGRYGEPAAYSPRGEPPRRPALQSVVTPAEDRDAEGEGGARGDGDNGGGRKRPAQGTLLEESADVKRRNKRLFGAILGTLQRFSKEEQELRSTAAAQRRAELERKAAEKREEDARRLREAARDERRQLREGDVARKREVSAAAACKRLEILYATRLARADKLASRFLRTATAPPLCWAPGKPSRETAALADAQHAAHSEWKAAQLEALEREKEELRQAMLAPRRGPCAAGGGGGEEGGEGGSGEGANGSLAEDMDTTEAGEAAAGDVPPQGDGSEQQQQQQQQEQGEAAAASDGEADEAEDEAVAGGMAEADVEQLLAPPVLEGEEEEGDGMQADAPAAAGDS